MNRPRLFPQISSALAFASIVWLGCSSTQTPSFADASRLASGEEPPPKVHRFDRVLTIVLENQSLREAAHDPYLNSLASRGASFTDFHGLFHPSYANYLAMVSGRLIKTPLDFQIDVDFPTIGDRLVARDLTWKNYAEGYPGELSHCFLGARQDRYVRKHVPFLSFSGVQRANCKNVVSADELIRDLRNGTFPNYAFYSPDLDNDGHDPVRDAPRGLAKASRWLESFLTPLLADANFRRGTLVIITFDESQGGTKDNAIYTVFLGDMVNPGGKVDRRYNHFNVLRTIEDNFGLAPLAEGDSGARPITEAWN